jgi:hypothetical protein
VLCKKSSLQIRNLWSGSTQAHTVRDETKTTSSASRMPAPRMGLRRHGRSCLLVAMAAVTAGAGTVTGTGNVTCPSTDRVMPGYSIFQGGIAAASTTVDNQTACCALCHGDYKDECQGWEWIDRTKVQCMGTEHVPSFALPAAHQVAAHRSYT